MNSIRPFHHKKKSHFVKKLNEQIQKIQNQVKYFNQRQQSRPLSKDCRRTFLRSLTEPKLHLKYQQQLINPEKQQLEPNSKISKLFRNNSAMTQVDFHFNQSYVNALQKSKLGRTSEIPQISKSIYMELFEKKNRIQTEWNKIDNFRNKNGMGANEVRIGKRVNSILSKVKNNRPISSMIYVNN